MIELNEEQSKRLLDFCCMTDLEFYEKHLADLTLEEQAAFMEEFPDFLSSKKVKESELKRKWNFQTYKSGEYVRYLAWLQISRGIIMGVNQIMIGIAGEIQWRKTIGSKHMYDSQLQLTWYENITFPYMRSSVFYFKISGGMRLWKRDFWFLVYLCS